MSWNELAARGLTVRPFASVQPVEIEWVREIRDACLAAGVPFHHKQWGGVRPKSNGKCLDGREWCEIPEKVAA